MNVVILHCHFERGGVTQVVENHVRWLRDCDWIESIVLVAGDRAAGLSDATVAAVKQRAIPDFDYDPPSLGQGQVQSRSDRIVGDLCDQLAELGISSDNSVLHWHNHSLGKNTAAPAAIATMARLGWRILLQIHDFAEDSRPENYHRLIAATGANSKDQIDRYLYPVASQIHYATLTQADAEVLAQLGVPATQTHCLPNSVVPPSQWLPDKQDALSKVRRGLNLPDRSRWCVYPVRGIRRKNVGELLLLSRWMPDDQYTGVTLAPTTPIERRSYERWRRVAIDVAPRASFDAGQLPDISFAENLAASEYIVSTSVAEGFGMAFLEPWLVDRAVIARRLPSVTDDFHRAGVTLSHLYDCIPVPGDDAWLRSCRAESATASESAWSSVPPQLRPSLELRAADKDGWIDFARLTPLRQIEVLQRASRDRGFDAELNERCAEVAGFLSNPPDADRVEQNAAIVGTRYSPQEMGRQLGEIYRELAEARCDPEILAPRHAGIGVDLIAAERPYFPCRTEVIDG